MDPEIEKAVISDWYYNQPPPPSSPSMQQPQSSSKFLTLPSILTLGRVAAVRFSSAMRLGSTFGAFLDPVAAKLMVAATLVLLCTKPLAVSMFGQVPWLLTVPAIAIIGREITMSAVREWSASQNTKLLEAVAVNNLGKWKTAIQMIALNILLATRDSSLIISVYN